MLVMLVMLCGKRRDMCQYPYATDTCQPRQNQLWVRLNDTLNT